MITAYKLLRKRKDGSLGSLFINRAARIPINTWLAHQSIPTRGYALRPGWHCMAQPEAPHLSPKGRVWCEVEIEGFTQHVRPKAQGGLWFLAENMRIVRELT